MFDPPASRRLGGDPCGLEGSWWFQATCMGSRKVRKLPIQGMGSPTYPVFGGPSYKVAVFPASYTTPPHPQLFPVTLLCRKDPI